MEITEKTTDPIVKSFLEQGLEEKHSVLMLGDDNRHAEHLGVLRDELPDMVQKKGLGTLAVEYPAFLNAFFWAYADGKIEQELGSKEAARDYMQHVLTAPILPEYQKYAEKTAQLVIDAMDQGMRVVAYDTTPPLDALKGQFLELNETLDWEYKRVGARMDGGLDSRQVEAYLRTHLNGSVSSLVDQTARAAVENIAQYAGNPENAKQDVRMLRLYHEANHWLDAGGKTYSTRFNWLEKLGAACSKHDISTDACSALILASMRLPEHPMVTLGHIRRIDGTGYSGAENAAPCFGTLAEHLEKVTPGGITIKKQVLGSDEMLKALHARQDELNAAHKGSVLRPDKLIDMLSLDTPLLVEHLGILQSKRIKHLPFEEHVADKGWFTKKAKRDAQARPLNIPEIANCALWLTNSMDNPRTEFVMPEALNPKLDYVLNGEMKPEKGVPFTQVNTPATIERAIKAGALKLGPANGNDAGAHRA